jgi:hypothetical protein
MLKENMRSDWVIAGLKRAQKDGCTAGRESA